MLLAFCADACSGPPGLADGGPRTDTSTPGADSGPIALERLPDGVWSFVRVPGAVCGNGSPAGIGVNPHAGARDLLIVIAGGGACWDADTCFGRHTATHIDEDYTQAMFDAERSTISDAGWDDRAALVNPFREANIVYVPYCTGDIHAGDTVQAYDAARPDRLVHHQGAVDMQLYVDAMRRAWPTLTTTRVVGFSAGGFGAQLNWGRFADAWPSSALAILADCAPPAELDAPLYATWRTRWDLFTPPGCPECVTSFSAYDDYFDSAYPMSRLGLLATTRDNVLTGFWGVTDFAPRVETLLTSHLDGNSTTRYFVVDSDAHVILGQAATLRSSDGTLLLDWVLGWLVDDARWHNTRP